MGHPVKNDPAALPPALPVKLPDQIEYAAGSVVSRTLARTNGGTITLFAFDDGQGLSEHTSPFDAFVQVLDGSVDLTIGGKELRASAGELVLMPATVPHALRAAGRFKMLLMTARGT